jgi:hypothetical protein
MPEAPIDAAAHQSSALAWLGLDLDGASERRESGGHEEDTGGAQHGARDPERLRQGQLGPDVQEEDACEGNEEDGLSHPIHPARLMSIHGHDSPGEEGGVLPDCSVGGERHLELRLHRVVCPHIEALAVQAIPLGWEVAGPR